MTRYSAAPRREIGSRCALVCLLLATIAAGCGWSPTATAGADQTATEQSPKRVVLRFVTEADFPPFNFYDEDGVLTGFNIDLARALCVELKTACDIKVHEWTKLFPSLNRGEADAAIASHSVSAQSLVEVDFTDRYFHTPGRFAGRRDTGQYEATIANLEGKRIGVASGTTHEAFIKQFFLSSRINVFDDADRAREALVDGSVDVVFGDAISLAFWLNGTLSKQCCEFKGGAFLEPKFFGEGIAVAVSRRDPALKQDLNGALKRIRASGRFDELVTRYFPFRLY